MVRAAGSLLGSRISGGLGRGIVRRLAWCRFGLLRFGLGLDQSQGDAEVRDLDAAVLRDHHVGRSNVAVHETPRVGGLESAGDSGGCHGGTSGRHRAMAPQQRTEVVAVNVLRDYIRSGRIRSEVVDRDDVGVAEPRRGTHGLAELGDEVGVPPIFGAKELHGHVPIQLDIVGAVDRGDVALAQQLHEPVTAPDHPSDLGHVRTSCARLERAGASINLPPGLDVVPAMRAGYLTSRVCKYSRNSAPMSGR